MLPPRRTRHPTLTSNTPLPHLQELFLNRGIFHPKFTSLPRCIYPLLFQCGDLYYETYPSTLELLLLLLLLSLLLLLLLLSSSIYFVLTSIRIYNKNLYSCSFKLIQVNITKKYTKKLKC